MVHNILLCSVRSEKPGPVVGTRPGRPVDVSGLSQRASWKTTYHTLLFFPRLACGQ